MENNPVVDYLLQEVTKEQERNHSHRKLRYKRNCEVNGTEILDEYNLSTTGEKVVESIV